MKRTFQTLVLMSLICVILTGCIHWQTSEIYELKHDISEIKSIRIYSTADNYSYSDPIEPCGELLGEIPAEQYAQFTEELTGLSFVESHMILLIPDSYDPNFYYGYYIVKIEYHDGSWELISDIIQRQFSANDRISSTTRYSTAQESWLAFLQNWVELPDLNNN